MKHVFIIIGVISTILIFTVLAGCAGNPIITGEKDPALAVKYCMEEISPLQKYLEDGHLYTTLAVSSIGGYDASRQLALSYYSQYPDIDANYEAVPVSLKYLLLPWKWGWRNDVTGGLHSLHGGDRAAIDERRRNIEMALNQTLQDVELDWLSGLIIHAYGDSYAHTKNGFDSKEERAYNVWIGHMIPSIFGNSPDNIKNELNEPKYLGYANDLYFTVKLPSGNDLLLDKFVKFVDSLECEGGLCPNFHALFNDEDAEKGSRIDAFNLCMNKSSRPLSKDEVQQAIDLIKGEGG